MEQLTHIELATGIIYLDEGGILNVRYKDGADIGLPEAKLHAQACIDVSLAQKRPFLIDGRKVWIHMTPDARKFFADSVLLSAVRKAQAILVDSTANMMLANFYMRVNKPVNPVRVFKNKEKAEKWLLEFL